MPITPSLRHCSNKYKLAREGEKDKEKDEDFEKVKDFFFFFFFFDNVNDNVSALCVLVCSWSLNKLIFNISIEFI